MSNLVGVTALGCSTMLLGKNIRNSVETILMRISTTVVYLYRVRNKSRDVHFPCIALKKK